MKNGNSGMQMGIVTYIFIFIYIMTHCEYIKRISMHYGKYNKLYQPTPAKMNLDNSSLNRYIRWTFNIIFFLSASKGGGVDSCQLAWKHFGFKDANNSVQFATVSVSEYI